jgi:hypothetical protein
MAYLAIPLADARREPGESDKNEQGHSNAESHGGTGGPCAASALRHFEPRVGLGQPVISGWAPWRVANP